MRQGLLWMITSPYFSIALNGSLVGFFPGKKGLRQGDPISPYLFVMAMEVLSLLLADAVGNIPRFGFHPRKQLKYKTNILRIIAVVSLLLHAFCFIFLGSISSFRPRDKDGCVSYKAEDRKMSNINLSKLETFLVSIRAK
jgi:hypothetical protein